MQESTKSPVPPQRKEVPGIRVFATHRLPQHLRFSYAASMTTSPFQLSPDAQPLGVILVDHGSRRDESNDMLLDVVREFTQATGLAIVETAHMELAEPSIATAFDRCVARGAKTVVVFPYFLLPGRHWHDDIPRLSAAAAKSHPGVRYLVTAPFGLHPLMNDVICSRIEHCLAHAEGQAETCDVCAGTGHCQIRGGDG
jgi:sirohydrochlorin ferrochelatase